MNVGMDMWVPIVVNVTLGLSWTKLHIYVKVKGYLIPLIDYFLIQCTYYFRREM